MRSGSWLLLAAGVVASLATAAPASAKIVQRTVWGMEGSGGGQFSSPEGVETDHSGRVYVADTGNNRIQKFSANGRFILTWGWGVRNGQGELQTCRNSCQHGLGGPGQGQLGAPNGVALDSEGHVYVADTGNDRIQKYSPSGRLLDQWGSQGAGPGEFDGSADVALGPAGHVYVADFYNGRIQKFSPGGRFLDQWPAPSPYGLATDSAGRVYAAEYDADLVEKFSPTGRLLRSWGGVHGSGDGEFRAPDGIATDAGGHVYVADRHNVRIQKFSGRGHFLTKWPTVNPANGEGFFPFDVDTNSAGRVYVVGDDRVFKYAQVPPRTKITAARIGDTRRRAKFRFKSSEAGSRFKCRLDRRRSKRCESPKVYRHLSEGQHTFRVRAIGPDELRDPTPAKRRFSIGK